MCARVIEDFETIDILVNNAGVTRDGLFRKMDRGAWDTVINTNLNSVFDITRRFIDRHGRSAAGDGSSTSPASWAASATSVRPTTPPPRPA